ncbi:MAG: sugar transferase [Acetobacteraceae bacterium]|nr:sugar transferase [Acetobacteraceae bacterium]
MRRVIDLILALAVLAMLLPVMACITLAIWLEDGRPIFFGQTRLGRQARCFRLLKFRKFRAQSTGGPNLTLDSDARMTRVGALLEKTKLDELPQLWNIVRGDMAIVGPRPESLPFADCLRGPNRALLDYRPGLFGPCQTIFRHERAYYRDVSDLDDFYRRILFPLKAGIDLAYYPSRTLRSDLAWAARSVLAVLGRSPLPQQATGDLKHVEEWIRNYAQRSAPGGHTDERPLASLGRG